MKTITLWTFILILFNSCSTESEPAETLEKLETIQDSNLQRKTVVYPENSANIYDAAGKLHNDISETYLTSGLISTTTTGTIMQVESLANLNSEFNSLPLLNYKSPTANRIDYILSNEQLSTLEIISNSKISLDAKLSLHTFLDSLMLYKDQHADYDSIIYPFIHNYESGIISSSSFTIADKRIVLTTTSIARYALYFATKHRRKPRDRDWETMWVNITAGIEGSDTGMAKAAVMAVV